MAVNLSDLLPIETASPEETHTLGRQLAGRLEPGDVVALYGDLGAGKTQLVKGICSGWGIDERTVSSPTFTILHEYDAPGASGPSVYHFDAYRLQHPDELFALGYEEYFYSDGLCLIEWPSRTEALLPDDALRLRLVHRGGDRRLISRIEDRG